MKYTRIFFLGLSLACVISDVTFAAPTVTLTANHTVLFDTTGMQQKAIVCDDNTTTPFPDGVTCREGSEYTYDKPIALFLLNWTSSNATQCQFLPTTDIFAGSKPIYETPLQNYGGNPSPPFNPAEILPTSGSRYYGAENSFGAILHSYNNVTNYARYITIECTDGAGVKAQSQVTLTATGNQPPELQMFGVLDVSYTPRTGMSTGIPIVRATPYVTELFMYNANLQDNVNAGMAGVDSLGLHTDIIDYNLDLTKEVFDVTEQAQDGSYKPANTNDYYIALRQFGGGDTFSNRDLTMTTPGVITVAQKVADSLNVYGENLHRWDTKANILFGKIGTYKIGFTAFDSTLDKGSPGVSSNMHVTLDVKCPVGYIQSGTTCRAPNRTVTIFEHGTDTGPNTGNSTLYDVGGGESILGYANKTSTSLNGPTLTIELGQSILTSARFSSEDSVDQFLMYSRTPNAFGGTTKRTLTGPGGPARWLFTYPDPNQIGWWFYKSSTPVANLPSYKRSILSTPVPHVDEYGFTTTYISFATTNDTGRLIQDRPETDITDSSQTPGVKNIPFTPTVPGLHKVCAAVSHYSTFGVNLTESCYNLQVNCPAGYAQSGLTCVVSGPPNFTISVNIRGKQSDSNNKTTTSPTQATSTDGSFYEWSYSISGQQPSSCAMQQQNDGGAWDPPVGYATDPNSYTLAWADLTQGEKTAFISSYTNTHSWKLTCTDAQARSSSFVFTINHDYSYPSVVSADIFTDCESTPANPTLTVSCVFSDYFEVIDTSNSSVFASRNAAQGVIPLSTPGTFQVVCKRGGQNGEVSPDSVTRTYTPQFCRSTINSLTASPKTINSGGVVALQWSITNPTTTCAITAFPVCNGTCSTDRTQNADALTARLLSEQTDANDPGNNQVPRTVLSALRTAVPGSGSPGTASGKKSLRMKYSTDFELVCSQEKRKVRVQVSNDKEG